MATQIERSDGAIKLYGEGLLAELSRDVRLRTTSPSVYFNVYGPRMTFRRLHGSHDPLDGSACRPGQPCRHLGDGSQTMDFVFVTDVARANAMAAELLRSLTTKSSMLPARS